MLKTIKIIIIKAVIAAVIGTGVFYYLLLVPVRHALLVPVKQHLQSIEHKIDYLTLLIDSQAHLILTQAAVIDQIAKYIVDSKYQMVTVTAYHPPSKGINSDKNPKRTATMKRPISGYTLAVSDELFYLGWLDRKIYVDGWGVGKATDRMKSTIQGKRIDVCSPSLKYAKKFGIRKNILAVVLE